MSVLWTVEYDDGTYLSEIGRGGRLNTFRDIDYARVTRLRLEGQATPTSPWTDATWDVGPLPQGWQLSFRRRCVHNLMGGKAQAFMVVVSQSGVRVHGGSVGHVTYWFPNGVTHECHLFKCPKVGVALSQMSRGDFNSLPSLHGKHMVAADANLIGG